MQIQSSVLGGKSYPPIPLPTSLLRFTDKSLCLDNKLHILESLGTAHAGVVVVVGES